LCCSATKLKVLDASGPPGHPALLASNKTSATAGGISALSFSPDGEVDQSASCFLFV